MSVSLQIPIMLVLTSAILYKFNHVIILFSYKFFFIFVLIDSQKMLSFQGWFTNTEMYYGFYTNETISIQSNRQYDMKLAYLFTCGGYYFLTLIILGQR